MLFKGARLSSISYTECIKRVTVEIIRKLLYEFKFNSSVSFELMIPRNVASVGSVFNDTRKVKVLSLPKTIKKKSTF